MNPSLCPSGELSRDRLGPRRQVLHSDIDLLNPPAELEKRKHKLKRLVPSPNSFFMDVKCEGCLSITTVFSHSQSVVVCPSCSQILCTPTGGRARLTEGRQPPGRAPAVTQVGIGRQYFRMRVPFHVALGQCRQNAASESCRQCW
ncbi:unnamed protein product [Ostreobium quekettii]|uniref:40S ribosomal protein S27 n=1 Tax=Ostreobium quekettii TaxID=121088 RepID=A0A8S1JEE5_9CHLO|nr:unnamed protein product [Ostreobium quekettii]|eukprot:evm.model.scf_405.6 EVM.evm.TU.scf_405.6   scf_405:89472-90245(-)